MSRAKNRGWAYLVLFLRDLGVMSKANPSRRLKQLNVHGLSRILIMIGLNRSPSLQ
jgi:hypothetical protein